MSSLPPLLRSLVAVLFMLSVASGPLALGANPCKRFGKTKEVTKGGEALVVGKPYVVPDLHLRFSDAETGVPVTPEIVRVFYYWEELRGYSSEHFHCHPQGDEMVIPSYEVRPRSWHRRWYSFLPSRKPRFTNIEIRTDFGYRSQSIIIWRKHLKWYRGKRLHIKGTRSALFGYWLEAPDGSVERVERDHGGPYGSKGPVTDQDRVRMNQKERIPVTPSPDPKFNPRR